MKKSPAALRRKVVDLYRSGVAPATISKEHNVSTASIYRWSKAKPNGPKHPGPPKTARQKRVARDGRRKKVAPIAAAVDAVLNELREPLILIVEKLVAVGVKAQLDNIADTIIAARKKHVAAIT